MNNEDQVTGVIREASHLRQPDRWLFVLPNEAKSGILYSGVKKLRLAGDRYGHHPEEGETVYDPACGSGGLLIKAQLRLREKVARRLGKDPRNLRPGDVQPTCGLRCPMPSTTGPSDIVGLGDGNEANLVGWMEW